MSDHNRPVALVTGASRGIGADLARELAKDGHDLVLTARTQAPMLALANELRGYGAAATIIAADLSRPGAAAALVQDIAARGLAIDVLVNNAGLGAAGRLDHVHPERVGEIVQVNIVALTELTRLLVPEMVGRGRGRIMLIGSIAGFQPGPRMAVYFASKAYVLSFGEAIAYELRGTGVSVTVVCPGATATDFFKVAGAEKRVIGRHGLRHMMSSAAVARQGYRALRAGRRVVVTGTGNRLFALAGRFMPHFVSLPITNLLMSGK